MTTLFQFHVNSNSRARIAVVIPARNEARIVSDTVRLTRSVLSSEDALFVIADHCLDNTASKAHASGAEVFERKDAIALNKGAALRWFVLEAEAQLKKFDVIVVLDADSRVASDFAEQIKVRIGISRQAWQCWVSPVDYESSPVATIAALSETIEQRIFDSIREMLAWPVRLRGTGMVFSPEVLINACAQVRTEVEDVSLTLLLVANGVPVQPLPNAIVYDPKPQTHVGAARQRARWIRGQWFAFWLHRKEVLKIILRGPQGWSVLSSLFLKPRWIVILAKVLALGICFLAKQIYPAAILGTWLLIDLLIFMFGLRLMRAGIPGFRVFLQLPRFVLMWLQSIVIAGHQATWLRAQK